MTAIRLFSPTPDEGASAEKFEALLGRLEEIVGQMENGEMPLEKLLRNYEEGMRLVKACGDRLVDAEQKVEILSRTIPSDAAKGAAAVAPETGKAGALSPLTIDTLPSEKPDDEIRLF